MKTAILNIKSIIIVGICAALLAVSASFVLASTASAQANQQPQQETVQIENKICAGSNINIDGNGASCDNATGETTKINNLIRDIVNILSVIVGIVAVIMIIVSGLKYITSGGDSNKVSSAKSTIIYAIIGLIIAALAQIIVRFVLSKVKEA